jgi:hypothetical protein
MNDGDLQCNTYVEPIGAIKTLRMQLLSYSILTLLTLALQEGSNIFK